MPTPRRALDVLLFWFGPRPYSAALVSQRSRLWFDDPRLPEVRPQTDELMCERFGEMLRAAERGEFAAWESSPRRRLALILLLDQFSRRIHRGSAHAFDQDLPALALTISGMQFGADATLDPVERIFFYMPLMHAEAHDVQEESVAAFRRLLQEAPDELRGTFESVLRAAVLHRDVIARFGRFPERNRILGRQSSDQELAWLAAAPENREQ